MSVTTILYGRVSTVEQTSEHQLTHAKAAGFKIDESVFDNGTSGVSTRLIERPEGRRLFDKPDFLHRNSETLCTYVARRSAEPTSEAFVEIGEVAKPDVKRDGADQAVGKAQIGEQAVRAHDAFVQHELGEGRAFALKSI
jgi:hypothetical protein